MSDTTQEHPAYSDLHEIAEQNNISTDGQKAISKVVVGHGWHWHQIPKDKAVELLTEIQTSGIEKVRNWGLAGKRKHGSVHSNADSETVSEAVSVEKSLHSNAEIVQVMDEKSGEMVDVTPEMRDEALQVHGQIEGAFWQIANALYRIVEERLYLALDYSSFEAYCADTLPWKARQAYDYALAGGEFGAKLVGDGEKHERADDIERIGISKMKLIARKASDQVDRLISEGKINIGDNELTTEDLANQTVRRLREELRKANSKLEKTELIEEQKKRVEMQNEELREKNEELAEFKEKNKTRADNREEIEYCLKQMGRHRDEVLRLLTRLSPEMMFQHSTEDQQEKLVHFLEQWDKSAQKHKNRHLGMIEAYWEESMEMDADEFEAIDLD